jgi:hypothetical protein
MKKIVLTILIIAGIHSAFAQRSTLDIICIHQLVDESSAEYDQQVKARNQQTLVTGNEKANLTLLEKLKVTYRTLQQRYNTLGTVIAVADIGIYAAPMVNKIIADQARIINLAESNPALIAMGYRTELEFAEKARSLAGYIAGLVLSYDDINQMKASDRKLLFDYVIAQLSIIQQLSGNMVNMMQNSRLSTLLRAADPFQNFINADKAIGKSIIQNAKYLK